MRLGGGHDDLDAGEKHAHATAARRVGRYGTRTNFTHTGAGPVTGAPVGVRRPDDRSMRKTTTVSEPWLAARRYAPVGSMP